MNADITAQPNIQTSRLLIRSVTDDGEIEGYVCVFGSPEDTDSYGTWFDRNAPPEMELKYLPVPLRYEHGFDPEIGKAPIGSVVKVWFDEAGLKFRAVLDKSCQWFGRVLNEFKQGMLATSSGTGELGYLAEFDEENRFRYWPLAELSVTASPAEERMPKVVLVRSDRGVQVQVSPKEGISIDNAGATGDEPIDSTANAVVARGSEQAASVDMTTQTNDKPKRRSTMLTLEQLGLVPTAGIDEVFAKLKEMIGPAAAQAWLNEQMGNGAVDPNVDPNAMPEMMSTDGRSKKPVKPAPKVEAEDGDDPIVLLRSELADLKKKMMTELPADDDKQLRSTDRISVGDEVRYAGKSKSDMEFAYLVMRSRNIQPSKDFMRNLGGKAEDAIAKGDASLNDPLLRSKLRGVRANEIAISTASGGGDEWVTLDYAKEVWTVTRNETTLIDTLIGKGMMVKEVPQGTESVQIPTEGADPTVYTIAQNADLTSGRPTVNVAATRIGTGSKTLTPGELGAAVAWSDVFDEDSIVGVSSQYNFQTTTKLKETVVQLWINADSVATASTNINLIDGTPGTGTSTPYYIASNGALKYALVTGSSTSRDGGTLDENDYRLTLKLMSAPTRSRLKQLIYVIDVDTHSASLDIAAIKTDEVKRTNATITSGVLTNIYGIDVEQTGFMPLANSSGKVPAAGGTLGRILCAYAPYWAMGWKRHITIETDRDILTGANILVAKMRVGFVARGADAATVTYNLTV